MKDKHFDDATMAVVLGNVVTLLDFPSGTISDANYREQFEIARRHLTRLIRELKSTAK